MQMTNRMNNPGEGTRFGLRPTILVLSACLGTIGCGGDDSAQQPEGTAPPSSSDLNAAGTQVMQTLATYEPGAGQGAVEVESWRVFHVFAELAVVADEATWFGLSSSEERVVLKPLQGSGFLVRIDGQPRVATARHVVGWG